MNSRSVATFFAKKYKKDVIEPLRLNLSDEKVRELIQGIVSDNESFITKFVNTVKFPVDLVDDVVVVIKNIICGGKIVVKGVVGGAFSVLCLMVSYVALKELYDDTVALCKLILLEDALKEKDQLNKYQDELQKRKNEYWRNIKKNIPTATIALGALGLASSLIFSVGLGVTVAGALFYPFAIMASITVTSCINLIKLVTDYSATNKEDKVERKHIQTKIMFAAVDLGASAVITVGIGIAAFSLLVGVSVAGFGLPLVIVAAASAIAVVCKIVENIIEKKHKREKNHSAMFNDKPPQANSNDESQQNSDTNSRAGTTDQTSTTPTTHHA